MRICRFITRVLSTLYTMGVGACIALALQAEMQGERIIPYTIIGALMLSGMWLSRQGARV